MPAPFLKANPFISDDLPLDGSPNVVASSEEQSRASARGAYRKRSPFISDDLPLDGSPNVPMDYDPALGVEPPRVTPPLAPPAPDVNDIIRRLELGEEVTPEEEDRAYAARNDIDFSGFWPGLKHLAGTVFVDLPEKIARQEAERAEKDGALWTWATMPARFALGVGEGVLQGSAQLGDLARKPAMRAWDAAKAGVMAPGDEAYHRKLWKERLQAEAETRRLMDPFYTGEKAFIPGAQPAVGALAGNFLDASSLAPGLNALGLAAKAMRAGGRVAHAGATGAKGLSAIGEAASKAALNSKIPEHVVAAQAAAATKAAEQAQVVEKMTAAVAKEAAQKGGWTRSAVGFVAPKLATLADATGKAAEWTGKVVDKLQPLLNVAGMVKGGVPGVAVAHLAGRTASRALAWSTKVKTFAAALRSVAKSDWKTSQRIYEQIAKDEFAPRWLKWAASGTVAPLVESTLRAAGAVGKGAATGTTIAAVAAGIDDTIGPQAKGEALGTGFALGSVGGTVGHVLGRKVRAEVRQAHDIAVRMDRAIKDGQDPAAILSAPDALMFYADNIARLFQGAMAQGRNLDVVLLDNAHYTALGKPGVAFFDEGSAGQGPRIVINAETPTATARSVHEAVGHALVESVVGNRPEMLAQVRAAVDRAAGGTPDATGKFLERASLQYAAALKKGETDPQVIADYITEQRNSSLDRYNDADGWVLMEILSEAAVRAVGGRGILDLGSPSFLGRASRFLEARFPGLAAKLEAADISGVKKRFDVDQKTFFDDVVAKALDDPDLHGTIITSLRDLGSFRPGLDAPKQRGVPVKLSDYSEGKPWAPLHDLPGGQKGTDFVKTSPDGSLVPRTPREVAAIVRNRQEYVNQHVPQNAVPIPHGTPHPEVALRTTISGLVERSGTVLGRWFHNSSVFSDTTKLIARTLQDAIEKGTALSGWYHEVASSLGNWKKNLQRGLGNVEAQFKDFIPIDFLIPKNGNLIVRNLSLSSLDKKASQWAARSGPLSLDQWKTQTDVLKAFKDDVKTYLDNHAKGLSGDSQGLGGVKRDVINAFLTGKNVTFGDANPLRALMTGEDRQGLIRSYRLDRLEPVHESSVKGFQKPDYPKLVQSFSPRIDPPPGIEEPRMQFSPMPPEKYPKKTIKAYKLFETRPDRPGELFPLFIGAKSSVRLGEWQQADFIPTKRFARRPGWHAGAFPHAPHLMQKGENAGKYKPSRVWTEVELPADVDWQAQADASRTGDIRDQIPEGGTYLFNTNPNQGLQWMIGGGIKVNRILSPQEVSTILHERKGEMEAALADIYAKRKARRLEKKEMGSQGRIDRRAGLAEDASFAEGSRSGVQFSPDVDNARTQAESTSPNERGTEKVVPESRFRIDPAVRGRDFGSAIRRTKADHPFGFAVDDKGDGFYTNPGNSLFLAPDGTAGVAVSNTGDLVSVFKHPASKTDVKPLLAEAAGISSTLDGFDIGGFLPNLYRKFGFRPVARIPFNREFAPESWRYDLAGEPDVVLMVKDPEGRLGIPDGDYNTIRDQVPVFTDYDRAVAAQRAAVEKVKATEGQELFSADPMAGKSGDGPFNDPAANALARRNQPRMPAANSLAGIVMTLALRKVLEEQPDNPMLTSALNVLYRDSPMLPESGSKRSNPKVAERFQEKAIEQWGRKLTSTANKDDPSFIQPHEMEQLISNTVSEIEAALATTGNAADWYTVAIEAAVEVMSVLHEELQSDVAAQKAGFPNKEAARLGMFMAMAITSQNLSVDFNSNYAHEQFKILKKKGAFDATREYGTKAKSISSNLALANKLIKEKGWDETAKFLKSKFDTAVLSKLMSKELGRKVNIAGKATDKVYGSAIFGPKIGQGFLQNLWGNFEPVTMDLWLRRTWGRWTGDVLSAGVTAEHLARLLDEARKRKLPIPADFQEIRTEWAKYNTGNKYKTLPEKMAELVQGDEDRGIAPDFKTREKVYKWAEDVHSQWQGLYKFLRLPVPERAVKALNEGKIKAEALAERQIRIWERLDAQWNALKAKGKTPTLSFEQWVQKDNERADSQEVPRSTPEQQALFWKLKAKRKQLPKMTLNEWKMQRLEKLGHTHYLDNEILRDTKPEWAKAANAIKVQLLPIDAPSDRDRALMTYIIEEARKRLEAKKIFMSNADIQAVLWYPEKDTWARMRGEPKSDLNLSYDSEFFRIAEREKKGPEAAAAIERVKKRRADEAAAKAAAVDSGTRGTAGAP